MICSEINIFLPNCLTNCLYSSVVIWLYVFQSRVAYAVLMGNLYMTPLFDIGYIRLLAATIISCIVDAVKPTKAVNLFNIASDLI